MSRDAHDLLIVTDATGSMGSYLRALNHAIPEILALSRLTGIFNRIGILAYRDYCSSKKDRILWSGWDVPHWQLSTFAASLRAEGGGDYPEAAKTALNVALSHCDSREDTLVLWYTDAPPHAFNSTSSNAVKERKAYPKEKSDFAHLSYEARNKRVTVFSFIPPSLKGPYGHYYVFLSEATGGSCIMSSASDSTYIAQLTLDVILQRFGFYDWCALEHSPLKHSRAMLYKYQQSPFAPSIKFISEANDPYGYITVTGDKEAPTDVLPLDLSQHISIAPGAESNLTSIGKRFMEPSNDDYRRLVYENLGRLIDSNVFSLTYNPVFGQLWRAVCKYKDNPDKQKLVDAFSQAVGQASDPGQKDVLQRWLEESYDASEEIEEIIASAPKITDYAYLDLDSGVQFTRRELLEASKSCYSGALQRLASIFTHLKVASAVSELAPRQRFIPLSLPPKEFFRLLPHLVVRGTLFPPRASAVTAILALVTDVPFLRDSAKELLQGTKGTWLNVDVPENLSFECARLLLSIPAGTALTEEEEEVYRGMRRYRLIEGNLESPLTVQVPWTPKKTRNVGDAKIRCERCQIKRSVTIMSHEKKGVCGLCIVREDGRERALSSESFAESDEMSSCWVECSNSDCLAQYVVEDVPQLRIRPKCHYCRVGSRCPWLECTKCTNRVVFPELYRNLVEAGFICPACSNAATSGRSSIESIDTSTSQLLEENGVAWLGLRSDAELLKGKSAFKLIQEYGFDVFKPGTLQSVTSLVFRAKKIHNIQNLLDQIEDRVGKGVIERSCCPLCFNDFVQERLVPVCGRKGCQHRVDEDCLSRWYNANEPGRLLNLMQTTCPFCRRIPTPKILTRYNRGIAALGGLKDAHEDRSWYYAWCISCGHAKRAFERQCCNGDGALPPLNGFVCDGCQPNVNKIARLTPCPKCGTLVEKVSGCNHIECQCGQHFCHVCGKAEKESSIYTHLNEVHGGIYDEDMFDDDGY